VRQARKARLPSGGALGLAALPLDLLISPCPFLTFPVDKGGGVRQRNASALDGLVSCPGPLTREQCTKQR